MAGYSNTFHVNDRKVFRSKSSIISVLNNSPAPEIGVHFIGENAKNAHLQAIKDANPVDVCYL